MRSKECIAMLLAGGQGNRLGILTRKLAKPAVPFGGKYRIIDFTLSNCINSGIDTVGVLTQYRPLKLNSYIGSGQPWDLDMLDGGISVLPPYIRGKVGEWYKGTANAIYQNIEFIEQYNPEYVLVLSGDHIYKMDYSTLIKHHKDSNAECTIAVIQVPWQEASRFGIMNTKDSGEIYEFEEKPGSPKSNKASMGIYVFNWNILKEYLIEDNSDPESNNDFGKNIIPAMLKDGHRMMAYPFDGYWKDVGTIQSLWEANMDLLKIPPVFNMDDPAWRIYSRNPAEPPHYISPSACVKMSIIGEGSMIYGSVDHSIIFSGVHIGTGAFIQNSIIMPNTRIGNNSYIYSSIVSEDVNIGECCNIGWRNENEKTKISPPLCIVVIEETTGIPAGTCIGVDTAADGYLADRIMVELLESAGREAKTL